MHNIPWWIHNTSEKKSQWPCEWRRCLFYRQPLASHQIFQKKCIFLRQQTATCQYLEHLLIHVSQLHTAHTNQISQYILCCCYLPISWNLVIFLSIHIIIIIIIIIIINPLTTRVVRAPQMILQPVFNTQHAQLKSYNISFILHTVTTLILWIPCYYDSLSYITIIIIHKI